MKMRSKLLICLLIFGFVLTIDGQFAGTDEESEETDIFESKTTSTKAPETTTTTTTTPTTTTTDPKTVVQICVDLKPDFVSTRSADYQTLECNVKMCDNQVDNDYRFGQPMFDWNSQLEHIVTRNGTCDEERLNCWSSININLRYLSHQMRDNGLNEIQFSCSVGDYLYSTDDNSVQYVVKTDYNLMKRFKGKGIDQSCKNDGQCGDNMFCFNSGRLGQPVCQCQVDFFTGVPYVQILDDKFNELICMPPLLVNDTCLYDQQCQAMDPNSVCDDKQTENTDFGLGICQCDQDMVYTKNNCQPKSSVESDSKPAIIWWIFTDYSEDNDRSVHRFWWLKTVSYLIAILAIFLPLTIILISMVVLCYRRLVAKRRIGPEMVLRPKFPAAAAAPKLIIGKKEKSDDKYDLVKNDHLIGQ